MKIISQTNRLYLRPFSVTDANNFYLLNKNPEVLGLNLIDLNVLSQSEYDPTLSHSQSISSESFNIGFTTEYVQIDASNSNTGDSIIVQLSEIINPITKQPKHSKNSSLDGCWVFTVFVFHNYVAKLVRKVVKKSRKNMFLANYQS